MSRKIIIGTRGSELALWQAHFTQSLLDSLGVPNELKIITTKGDQIQHLSFDKIEGKGFFTKEIEQALMDHEIDIAVHSHKDLETAPHPHLIIGAVSHRADPRDILITHKNCIEEQLNLQLQKNIRVGTSSIRRKTQLLNIRPDLTTVDIRGNVPTRIQKLRDGQCDALMLAAAGVARLNIDLSEFHVQLLDPTSFIPAPAQGVLGWQCRRADDEILSLLQQLNNQEVADAIHIERTLLQKLEGGCQLPLGVYCTREAEQWMVNVAFANGLNQPVLQFKYAHGAAETCIEYCFDKLDQWRKFSSANI
ncbi:MAG: hydroxymethylbilane synthase [Bacteroidota bacterium]|jgi:hydroxymethylbilane synthase